MLKYLAKMSGKQHLVVALVLFLAPVVAFFVLLLVADVDITSGVVGKVLIMCSATGLSWTLFAMRKLDAEHMEGWWQHRKVVG